MYENEIALNFLWCNGKEAVTQYVTLFTLWRILIVGFYSVITGFSYAFIFWVCGGNSDPIPDLDSLNLSPFGKFSLS